MGTYAAFLFSTGQAGSGFPAPGRTVGDIKVRGLKKGFNYVKEFRKKSKRFM